MKGSIWINLLVGVWLVIAPFALATVGVTSAWATNDVVVGVLLIGFSWWILATVTPPSGAAPIEIVCGAWLIIAPFVLGYSGISAAVWNDVICGIIAIIVAAAVSQVRTHTPRTA